MKRPSLMAKNRKNPFYKEKSLVGLTPSLINFQISPPPPTNTQSFSFKIP
jgi:hypothetical protein